MRSISIKDTTREEREQIIRESLDCGGGALKGSSGGFGISAGETLAGHGTAAELTMADGAVATLDGNLGVTTTLTAEGALSFVRKTGVETNVTVAATGTLTATNAITVGAGVNVSALGRGRGLIVCTFVEIFVFLLFLTHSDTYLMPSFSV